MNVANWLLRADPAAPAVNSLTYEELLDRARRIDLPSAARIGIAMPPGEDFAVALHATWLRGSVAVPHDLRLDIDQRPPADLVIHSLPERGAPCDPAELDLDAPAVLMQTSGTTARPKQVELTFGNLLWSALGSAAALDARPGDRWLCALPLSHVGGLSILVRSAIYGTHAILHERWVTADVAREDVELISVVPTTLGRLLDAGWTGTPSLRWVLVGGAPMPDALRERAQAAGLPVAETYGLTEAASQVTTFGVPLFCTCVRVAGDGEILVSGPTAAGGAELATGDLGEWQADGTLAITGRKSEMIVTGGENVAPLQVETVLETHPDVAEAMVFGWPDPEWGQAVHATVVVHEDAVVTASQLREYCSSRLAGFQVPKQIDFSDELPRTPTGKLVRPRV